jgi:putative methyltransferase (TIGR04325 family)
MSRPKAFLRAVLPPVIVDGTRRVRGLHKQPTWEYVPDGWAKPVDAGIGWDVGSVAGRHRAIWDRWLGVLSGTGALGVDFWMYLHDAELGTGFDTNLAFAHNAVMTFGYVLARTAQHRTRISVLDWGAGVGQYAPLARTLLPEVEIEYHCKDVPALTAVGRDLLPDVTFHDDDDSCLNRRYDLVLVSSSLQYIEQWQNALRRLAGATENYLLLTRTPTVANYPSFVVVQRGQPYGFGTDVLEWFFNRDELLECAEEADLRLVREFVMMDATPAKGVPEQARYRGFLFEPTGEPNA